MKYEYDKIEKTVKYMGEYYSFRDLPKGYPCLVDLLNVIGEDGWELVGQISGEGIIVKRVI